MDLHRTIRDLIIGKGMHFVMFFVLLLLLSVIVRPVFAAVCAEVKIEIKQELTLERQAFEASMRINNGLDGITLENVIISLVFTDELGLPVLFTSDPNSTVEKFYVSPPTMTGITGITGGGVVAPLSSAEVNWLIIPSTNASEDIPTGKLYLIGATLSYSVGGKLETVEIAPDSIFVKPLPKLTLDYFLTQDVFADDAFTPQIEPAEIFTLGVRVTNSGAATAQDVQIDSAQPKIIENDQGLLIGFNIVGSYVNDQPSTNSLKINLGDIPSNDATMGRWEMLTTLSGVFTDFSAEFSHADELGGALTSILQATNAHFLIRNVLVDEPGRDTIVDFLGYPTTGDESSLFVYESNGQDFSVLNQSASSSLSPTPTGYMLNTPVTAGFMYVKLPDPAGGTQVVQQVVRSDGKFLPLENVWASKTRNKANDPPTWEYWINVLDSNTTSTYAITMGVPMIEPVAPVFGTINNVVTYETNPVAFPVFASDANGDVITITIAGTPNGASFVDAGNGSGNFNWSPIVGDVGSYIVTFIATDAGGLSSTNTITITVNTVDDTDGDGLPDQWELDNFGDLSKDGSADSDGDGVTDYNEFLAGTDPNVDESQKNWSTPLSLGSVLTETSSNADIAADGSGNAVAVWQQTSGARTDIWSNIYTSGSGWGVATLVELDDVGSAKEPSVKIDSSGNATVVWLQSDGTRDNLWSSYLPAGGSWSIPVLVENDDIGDAGYHAIAIANNDDVVALWSQADGTLDANSAANPNTVYFNRYIPGTGWGAATRIENNSTIEALGTQIAVDANGDMVAVWSDTADGTTFNIQTNSYVVATGWGSAQSLRLGALGDALSPQVTAKLSMNTTGNAVIVWAESATVTSIWAQQYTSGVWGTAITLESSVEAAYQPDVAIDESDNIVAVFAQADGTRYSIRSTRYTSGTGWGSVDLIGTTDTGNINGDAANPTVGLVSNGNAIVAWQQTDGYENNIWTNNYTVTGTTWASAQIIEDDNTGDASIPSMVVMGNSVALVVWQQASVTGTVISGNAYLSSNTGLPNIDPVIVTTNTISVDEQTLVTLDASSTFDQDGTITAYSWLQTAGPVVTLADASVANTSFTAPVVLQSDGPQVLSFIVTATDDLGAQNSDLVDVTVNPVNVIPSVSAGIDQNVNEQITVNLNGVVGDTDGSVANVIWTQIAGPLVTLADATAATTSFGAPVVLVTDGPQLLSFVLTATDNEGAQGGDQIDITVNPVNAAPIASAGIDQSVNEQTVVSLSAGASDTDGSIVSVSWTQIAGPVVTLLNANLTNTSFTAPVVLQTAGPQVLSFVFTATDNEGGQGGDQIDITVNPVNAISVVNAGIDQIVDEQTSVSLTGSANDTDGSISSTNWTQIAGPAVILADVTATSTSFTAPLVLVTDGSQVLSFILTATDNEGGQGSDQVDITVNPVNIVPSVNAGIDQVVDEQTAVTLNGSASDADGLISSTNWTQIAGPVVALADDTAVNTGFTAPVVLVIDGPQLLSFVLTATDNEGVQSSDQIDITVNPFVAVTANGDVNGDGEINVADILLMQRHVLGIIILDTASIQRGDLYPATGDAELTLSDVILLQKLVLGVP